MAQRAVRRIFQRPCNGMAEDSLSLSVEDGGGKDNRSRSVSILEALHSLVSAISFARTNEQKRWSSRRAASRLSATSLGHLPSKKFTARLIKVWRKSVPLGRKRQSGRTERGNQRSESQLCREEGLDEGRARVLLNEARTLIKIGVLMPGQSILCEWCFHSSASREHCTRDIAGQQQVSKRGFPRPAARNNQRSLTRQQLARVQTCDKSATGLFVRPALVAARRGTLAAALALAVSLRRRSDTESDLVS